MLYFAYTTLIDPSRIREHAPEAEFQFVAHLPETQLIFPYKNGTWKGGLPSVKAEPGNTVWGAIFDVPGEQLSALDVCEKEEGRVRVTLSAMDRSGKRHTVATHVHEENGNKQHTPSPEYMAIVVAGSRHWQLPAGWVAGLEEYVSG